MYAWDGVVIDSGGRRMYFKVSQFASTIFGYLWVEWVERHLAKHETNQSLTFFGENSKITP